MSRKRIIQMIVNQPYILYNIFKHHYFICMIMRNMQEESASPLDAAISGRIDSKWWNRSTAAFLVGRQLAAWGEDDQQLTAQTIGWILRLHQLAGWANINSWQLLVRLFSSLQRLASLGITAGSSCIAGQLLAAAITLTTSWQFLGSKIWPTLLSQWSAGIFSKRLAATSIL